MSEWKEYKLGDIAEVKGGKRLPKGDMLVDYETPHPYIRVTDFGKKWVRKKGLLFVTPEIQKSISRYTVDSGNVILSIVGSIGFVGRISDELDGANLTENCVKFLINKKMIDDDFLYYYLISNIGQEEIEKRNVGSTQPKLPIYNIKDIDIFLPPLPEQTAIASVLSSLDDKIDLLYRQNTTLEKMAETLFRQWFVEEAKEEWEMGKLGDEFDFVMGASPPGESYNEEGNGIPMYQGNADFGFRFPTNRVFTTDPKRFAEKFDTLISVRAPVGEQNMANERCCIGRGVAAFRYKKDNSFYSYTYYKMKSLMDEIKQFNETGTVFGSISKSDFESIDNLIPDLESITRFQCEAKPFDEKIMINQAQIRTLTTLRDTLLPKLMSGEVKIKL
ncbi:MAG: restriction endonuclease subunit S [Lacibacter sp.]